ncbi:hypothetical protein D3C72_1582570 [compost metagenome]
MAPVNTCEMACTSVPASDNLMSLSALRKPLGRPRARPNCSARSARKVLSCRSDFVCAITASTWSSCDRARKMAVRSPNDSCKPPVCGGLLLSSQFGLRPSSTACPVSCETMSSERQV